MRAWTAQQVADAARAELAAPGAAGEGPARVTIDSRDVRPGDLFVGLPGARVDGGVFAAQALADGAWGVLVGPGHEIGTTGRGVVLRSDEPLVALQTLATAWRRALGAKVIGITGSTGKTSTKDVLAGMLAPHLRTVATRQNLNTEIGLPLTILSAPQGTEALVLEMAMRGPEQIAELTRDRRAGRRRHRERRPGPPGAAGLDRGGRRREGGADPGPAARGDRGRPAEEPLLEPHRTRRDLVWVTFGPGGDVDDLGGVELPFTSRTCGSTASPRWRPRGRSGWNPKARSTSR